MCRLSLPVRVDTLRTQQELEWLQAKYIGTGHLDMLSWEWKTDIHCDMNASIVGHPLIISYITLAQNEPSAKIRANLAQASLHPVVVVIARLRLINLVLTLVENATADGTRSLQGKWNEDSCAHGTPFCCLVEYGRCLGGSPANIEPACIRHHDTRPGS